MAAAQARSIKFLRFAATSIRKTGLFATSRWILATARYNLRMPGSGFLEIKPRLFDHPVRLRTTTSDPFVYRQIMIEDEYSPLLGLRIRTIIDLGANIGLASAWFLNRIPGSSVFAVEADRDNYMACRENLMAYNGRAAVLQAAAWSNRTTLKLYRRTCAADNIVREDDSGGEYSSVEGLDMPTIIELSGFDRIDLLKIDIEGAEGEIFSNDVNGWLPSVRNLCIEIHGESCRRAFFAAVSGYDYEHLRSGELTICLNLRKKTSCDR